MPRFGIVRRNIRLLVLNPNSSVEMTTSMEAAIQQLPLPESLDVRTYTAPPPAPDSINDDDGIEASTQVVQKDHDLAAHLESEMYDAIVIACFSVHKLHFDEPRFHSPYVTGIMGASVVTAISLLGPNERWGIVTTGAFWEKHLSDGVKEFLGHEQGSSHNDKFAGVYTSGLNAGDFHSLSPQVVRDKLTEATRRLLQSSQVRCVVMGCAGMARLEDIIHSTAVEVYGAERAATMYVLDAVQCGVLQAELAVRSRRAFAS